MRNRAEMVEILQDFLDRKDSGDLPEELRQVLESDAELREIWRQLREVERVLPDAADEPPEVPLSLHQGIMERVGAAQPPLRGKKYSVGLWLVAAAVAALVAISALSGRRIDEKPMPIETPVLVAIDLPSVEISQSQAASAEYLKERSSRVRQTASSFIRRAEGILPQFELGVEEDLLPEEPKHGSSSRCVDMGVAMA